MRGEGYWVHGAGFMVKDAGYQARVVWQDLAIETAVISALAARRPPRRGCF